MQFIFQVTNDHQIGYSQTIPENMPIAHPCNFHIAAETGSRTIEIIALLKARRVTTAG